MAETADNRTKSAASAERKRAAREEATETALIALGAIAAVVIGIPMLCFVLVAVGTITLVGAVAVIAVKAPQVLICAMVAAYLLTM